MTTSEKIVVEAINGYYVNPSGWQGGITLDAICVGAGDITHDLLAVVHELLHTVQMRNTGYPGELLAEGFSETYTDAVIEKLPYQSLFFAHDNMCNYPIYTDENYNSSSPEITYENVENVFLYTKDHHPTSYFMVKYIRDIYGDDLLYELLYEVDKRKIADSIEAVYELIKSKTKETFIYDMCDWYNNEFNNLYKVIDYTASQVAEPKYVNYTFYEWLYAPIVSWFHLIKYDSCLTIDCERMISVAQKVFGKKSGGLSIKIGGKAKVIFFDSDNNIICEEYIESNCEDYDAIRLDVYKAVKFKVENEGINTLFVRIMPDVFNSSKHFHNPVSDLKISATCDTDGKTQGSHCLECKEIIVPQNIIPAIGHSFKEYVSNKDATCTLDGTKTGICENGCGTTDTILDVGSAKGHTPISDVGQQATCTTEGTSEGMHCGVCNAVIVAQNIIPATGHSFKEYVSNKDATCILDGTKTAICKNGCGTTDTIQDVGSATGHRIEVTTIESTCTEQGKQTTICMECDYIEEKDLELLNHEYSMIYTIDKKATLYSIGSMSRHCKNAKCTSKKDSKSIAKISSVKLSATSYTYSGKIITPTVIVKNAVGTMLKKDVDYTVKYASGRKNPGQYNVIVSFTGQYSGTKSLTFEVSPKVPTNVKATQTTHEITLRWSKSVGATGYEIYQYNTNNKRYTKVGSTTETKIAIKGRKSGTKYNYVIRAYKKVGSNNIKSAYSTMIKTTTKPGTPKIKVTAGTKSATISWNKVSGASGYVVYMSTKKNGGYKRIATLGSETLKYKKLYLTKGKIYYFKVKAFTKNSTEIYGAESLVKLARIK